MTEAVLTGGVAPNSAASTALRASARLWFLVATFGMWIFVIYVAARYGPLIVQEGLEGLKETHLPNGYIAGDTIGNLAMVVHLLLAVIIIGGGPLQLIPQIRSRAPAFHHWLGRTYMLTAVTSSIAGLYLVWSRPLFGSQVNRLAISLDGVLIILFAAIALRYAIARNIRTHRRWALRLFMVASGVWFFRIGYNLWYVLTGGVGIDYETFTGPFLYVWGFGQYLLPLAVLELYFRASDRASATNQFAVATVIFSLTVFMGIGIFAATMNMWLPRL